MRQLPATSSSGATSTDNNRSRSSQLNETPGNKTLSNGSVKEPILTRSKSRLKVGRRLPGRSPKKLTNSQKFVENEGAHRKKPDKGTGNATSSTTSISSPLPSPSPKTASSSTEKMYARHYKSYRGLNGVTSRRGERSPTDGHSNLTPVRKPHTSENSTRDSRRAKKASEKLVANLRKCRTVSTRNHVQQNGVLTPLSKHGIRNPSSRIRQLNLRKRKNRDSDSTPKGRMTDSSDASSPIAFPKRSEGMEDADADPAKDKAGKRRSALWVLNCEAEEFLFGETAAEKHEVELPPLAPPSPPPKKRRCRVNELGHLLEKSPILESKLRKTSSSECGSDMQRDASPLRKRLKPDTQRAARRLKNKQHNEKTPEMCSSNSVKGCTNQPQSPKPELLSPIPFLYSPDSVDPDARAVQFQQMLTNVDWGYSFEEPPVNEPWYSAFTRTDTSIIPFESFVNPLHEPVVLPYEMDKMNRRSRSKPMRNSRKSPRCHASTLAILSSERPTRSTRSSVTLDTSPSASVNNLASESTLQALLLPPAPIPIPSTSTPIITTRLSPPKYIPVTSRRRHPSSPRPCPSDSKNELGAAQYLWDSMQFLSDPYVVTLLSGEDPEATTHDQSDNSKCKSFAKNNRCTNNNYVNCPVKSLVKNFETSSRKASLRSGDGTGTSTNPTVNSNCIVNSRVTSVPKSSPRNQSHGTNHTSGHKVASPLVSPSATVNDNIHGMNGVTRRFTSRSPPLSPPARQTVCPSRLSPKNLKGTNSKQSKTIKGSGSEGDNGLISHEKSKKAKIVFMADLFTASTGKTKMNNWEEDTLFIGDGLPPLPSWPV